MIALTGSLVVLLGIIMIPYPGPGWLVVFLGLGILATEFVWAKALLAKLRMYYEIWRSWLARQNIFYKALFWLLTCVVVIATVWLLNGFGLINAWFGLGMPWLQAPYLY